MSLSLSFYLCSSFFPHRTKLPIMTEVQDIQVHEPGSKHSSLLDGPGGFDRKWFMGTWGVAWSTLPMWEKTRGKSTLFSLSRASFSEPPTETCI
jgi:hypothetical protein